MLYRLIKINLIVISLASNCAFSMEDNGLKETGRDGAAPFTKNHELPLKDSVTELFYSNSENEFIKKVSNSDILVQNLTKEAFLNQKRSGDLELFMLRKIQNFLENSSDNEDKYILNSLVGCNYEIKKELLKSENLEALEQLNGIIKKVLLNS